MRAALILSTILLVAGCQALAPRTTAGAAQVVSLDARDLTGPVMQIALPSRKASASMRRSGVNGDVETWVTADDRSFSFRQGVLVATRGLGFDLMGADAQGTLDAMSGTAPPVYRRHMRFLSGENHAAYLMAGCSMTHAGPETVRGARVQRWDEACQMRSFTARNSFWVNAAGQVIQSRQWVSPEIGYVIATLPGR